MTLPASEELPRCPSCGGSGIRRHHREAGHLYFRCPACAIVFLHPAPSPDELERIYREEAGATFHHGAEIAGDFEKRWEATQRIAIANRALEGAPDRSALEIGCGAGYLLDRLRARGWRVAGTEMSDDYIRHAREKLRLDVGREFPPGPFGAVLLFNVLSHLPDPVTTLRRCAASLLPDGALVLETGNAAEVPAWRVGPFGAPEHLRHFSERSLRALLDRAGFADVRVRRLNVEWQRRALRLLAAVRSRPAGGAGPTSSVAGPSGTSSLKKAIVAALLGLRFGAGRFLADSRHFCTLFVTARARGRL
jgi:SAM-dependent methyltransferase